MTEMDCAEVRDLLHPYADNELPPEERRAVAAHLGACGACAQHLAELEGLRYRVKKAGTHALPAGLEKQVGALISANRNWDRPELRWRIAGRTASHLAAVALGGAIAVVLMARIEGEQRIVDDVVSAHVRSLLGGQPAQIASADPHVIRPWFGGKVTYAPQVKDLASEGFPLQGARVDYVPPQAVAAIVYGRRLHRITLFILPAEQGPSAAAQVSRYGYNLVSWRDPSFSYYAVSDLNRVELEHFASLIRLASAP
jgi:anti-sigma factor RsiW